MDDGKIVKQSITLLNTIAIHDEDDRNCNCCFLGSKHTTNTLTWQQAL